MATHRALNLLEKKTIVFTALSKKYFYMRMFISAFVLEQGCVPINPFTSFDYYLADLVDRDVTRNANNNLVRISEELWIFGTISNGVAAEIIQAKEQNKPIRYFKIEKDKIITEITTDELEFEEDAKEFIKDIKI